MNSNSGQNGERMFNVEYNPKYMWSGVHCINPNSHLPTYVIGKYTLWQIADNGKYSVNGNGTVITMKDLPKDAQEQVEEFKKQLAAPIRGKKSKLETAATTES